MATDSTRARGRTATIEGASYSGLQAWCAAFSGAALQTRPAVRRPESAVAAESWRSAWHGAQAAAGDMRGAAGSPTNRSSGLRQGHGAMRDLIGVERQARAGATIAAKTQPHESVSGMTVPATGEAWRTAPAPGGANGRAVDVPLAARTAAVKCALPLSQACSCRLETTCQQRALYGANGLAYPEIDYLSTAAEDIAAQRMRIQAAWRDLLRSLKRDAIFDATVSSCPVPPDAAMVNWSSNERGPIAEAFGRFIEAAAVTGAPALSVPVDGLLQTWRPGCRSWGGRLRQQQFRACHVRPKFPQPDHESSPDSETVESRR